MKRKFISLITAFSLMFMIFNLPVDVFAANSPTSGDNVTWEYNNSAKTLIISGIGAMVDYEYGGNHPWYSYHKEITTVVIQDGVTHIGKNAFWFLNNVTAVTIPKSVTTIGDNAFSSCSSLTSITFPGDVESIGKSAFSSCNAITKIKLDSTTTVPTLGDYALDGCSSNMKVVVPPEMKEAYLTAEGWWANHKDKIVPAKTTSGHCSYDGQLGSAISWTLDNNGTLTISGSGDMRNYKYDVYSPFYNDDRIKNVVISDGITRIGKYTFEGCRSLESITIPDSVNLIGYSSFGNCSSLQGITVSSNVRRIRAHAFSGCTSLSNVTLSEGALYDIGEYAFWGCSSLSSITIPNSVTTMGEFAFSSCTSLSNVTLSNKLTSISQGAFYKCNLSSVEIPQSVTSIGLNAFAKNTNLSSVTIPSNVTVLEGSAEYGGAFDDCTSLESVKFEGTTTIPTLKENAFRNCKFFTDNDESTGITLPSCEYLSAYLNTSGWDTYKDYILTKHTITEVTAEDATCIETGNTKHWKCSVCGKLFSDSEGKTETTLEDVTIPAAHKLTNVSEKTATCTEAGNTEHWKCSKCGKLFTDSDGKTETTLEDVTIPAAHKLTSVSEKAATCTEAGNMEHWKCSVCGKLFSDSMGTTEATLDKVTTPAKGHTLTHIPAKEATETETGNTEYWKCTGCGKLFSDSMGTTETTLDKVTTPAKGHTLTHIPAKEATETETGNTEYWKCTGCGKLFSDSMGTTETTLDKVTTPAKGHTLTYIPAKEATETETGNTEYWKCTVCGKLFSDSMGTTETTLDKVTIPATGTEHIHDFGTDWKYDNTNHWHECNCGEKSDLTAHIENSGTVTVQPTETTTGIKTYYCTVCKYEIRTETVPATGTEHVHDFGTDWKYDNTNHWHECICGEKSDLAAHSENGGVVTLAPTGTTNGEMTYRCNVCGTITRTETIPATGVIPVPTPTPVPPSPPVTYPDSIVSPVITADSDEPFIVDNSGIEGWEAISEDIHITADGGIVDIDMNGTVILPKSIVEDIAGRDIDLALEMDSGITWTINGLTVTNAQRTNMKVYMNRSRIPANVLNTVSEGLYVKELTLKHTGEFGFTPVLTVKLPDKFDDKYANLFYYNSKSKEMEFVNFSVIKDGTAKLAFTHASEYAVVVSDMPMGGEDISVAAGIFSDSDMLGKSKATYPVCVTVVLIAAGISTVIFVRRKQK